MKELITNLKRPALMRSLLEPSATEGTIAAAKSWFSAALRGLAVMAGLALVGVIFVVLFEAALYPWARSLTGGPTLVSECQGELTTPTGRHRVVRFVVNPLGEACRNACINGTARMCDERGEMSNYQYGATRTIGAEPGSA